MKKHMKTNGITLIALVVTIVLLLILAGITFSFALGENGIIAKTIDSKNKSIIASEKESIDMALAACKTENKPDDFDEEEEENNTEVNLISDELHNEGKDVEVNAVGYNISIKFNSTGHEYIINQDDKVYTEQEFNDSIKVIDIGELNGDTYFKTKDNSIYFDYNLRDGWNLEDLSEKECYFYNIKQISNQSLLSYDGKVYTMYYDYGGDLFEYEGNYKDYATCLTDIPNNELSGKKIVYITDDGASHYAGNFFAIDDQGKVYAWGNNYRGQLGIGNTDDEEKIRCISDIEGSQLKNKKIKYIYYDRCSIAIDEDGKVYTWGSNVSGQLGQGNNDEEFDCSVPICISDIEGSKLNGKKISNIYTQDYSIYAIDENGKLYAWGDNFYGQLGIGTNTYVSTPICINDVGNSALKDKKITKLKFKGNDPTVYVLDEDGKLYTWGNNEYGELGDGTKNNSNMPICISDLAGSILNGKKITKMDESYDLVLDEDGKAYYWRMNNQYCINEVTNSIVKDKKIIDIAYHINNQYLLCTDQKLYSFYELDEPIKTICLSDDKDNILYNLKIKKMYNYYWEDELFVITEDDEVYYYYEYFG